MLKRKNKTRALRRLYENAQNNRQFYWQIDLPSGHMGWHQRGSNYAHNYSVMRGNRYGH